MIYTLNTRDNVMFSAMQGYFLLDNRDIYREINFQFGLLVDKLKKKKIDYTSLKRALIPNQDKDKREIAFVFDSTQILSGMYGHYIFGKLIPLLPKESTFSILTGDYIDSMDRADSQNILKEKLVRNIVRCHDSIYRHSSQYFIVYLNSISETQLGVIINGLGKESSFYGYADLGRMTPFKTYLAYILGDNYIVNKKNVLMAHEAETPDEENINLMGYPFKDYGFQELSFDPYLFMLFLSYKIETMFPDLEDIRYSLNVLCIDYSALEEYTFVIGDEKAEYLKTEKRGILEKLGLLDCSTDALEKYVFQAISENYIYNLAYLEEYDTIKFNICAELPTLSGNVRKTTLALKYLPSQRKICLITLT